VDEAAEYIAGYALANEVSLPEESFYRPAIKAKCRDGFCPLGELAALDHVDNLTIVTEINGREADHWNTADLQRNAAELLSALSEFATLSPGDAILLGTPHSRVPAAAGRFAYAFWRKASRPWKTRWLMNARSPMRKAHIRTPRCSRLV
jgi:5-oxopent-3-ene-1,2,5-tricarboxylate decarboxylase/2-hydroxyhepta-2,4-diene-1,7-dioate isomerase